MRRVEGEVVAVRKLQVSRHIVVVTAAVRFEVFVLSFCTRAGLKIEDGCRHPSIGRLASDASTVCHGAHDKFSALRVDD